ncbi:MAG: ABC transporter ATP-binding protein [Clostridiales bacterium]|nr:ABC transporter ATP-binding protein [Clostridiales bacterium]
MIVAKNVTKIYGKFKTEVKALDNVTLNIKTSSFVAVRGPSGSGKSTLLNILGCLEKPTSGTALIDGVDISLLSDLELTKIRRNKIGFIFQNYNLIPTLTAIENISLPMMFNKKSAKEIKIRADKLLKMVDMHNRSRHKPSELSGGEQQRVAIARALANEPKLIIGDEPTGNLDSKTGAIIMNYLQELNSNGCTMLLVTHDPEISALANNVVQIKDGQIVSSTLPKEDV